MGKHFTFDQSKLQPLTRPSQPRWAQQNRYSSQNRTPNRTGWIPRNAFHWNRLTSALIKGEKPLNKRGHKQSFCPKTDISLPPALLHRLKSHFIDDRLDRRPRHYSYMILNLDRDLIHNFFLISILIWLQPQEPVATTVQAIRIDWPMLEHHTKEFTDTTQLLCNSP